MITYSYALSVRARTKQTGQSSSAFPLQGWSFPPQGLSSAAEQQLPREKLGEGL